MLWWQILAECIVSFVLALVGIVAWQVHPQDIHVTRILSKRPLEAALNAPNFNKFNHRGRAGAPTKASAVLAGAK